MTVEWAVRLSRCRCDDPHTDPALCPEYGQRWAAREAAVHADREVHYHPDLDGNMAWPGPGSPGCHSSYPEPETGYEPGPG